MKIDVLGGHILFSQSAQSMDAHCATHKNCKCDRSVAPTLGNNKGRPLGRHLVWLAEGGRFATREEHAAFKREIGLAVFEEDRKDARKELEARSRTDAVAAIFL